MTTAQIVVVIAAYAVVLAATIYFTRATFKRVMGALAGGAAAGIWAMGAVIAGESIGVWRDFLPADHTLWILVYLGFAISSAPLYLVTWRVERRFGAWGLAVCLIVAAVIGPPRDALYLATYPKWGAFGPGLAPLFADSITYVAIIAIGHAGMRLICGPSRETGK
jgi:hypothetical protein